MVTSALALLSVGEAAAQDKPPGGDKILRLVDEVRFPMKSLQMVAVVRTYKDKKLESTQRHVIKVSADQNRTLVQTVAPPRWKGRLFLAAGENLWVYFPRTAKPLRISPQQRLAGQVSNGDLARIVYSVDYSAKVAKTTDKWINQAMKRKSTGATYHKATLWVERGTYRPIKASFYAKSGKLMKVVRYGGWTEVLGAKRPLLTEIKDPLRPSQRSTITYGKMKLAEMKNVIFSPSYLPHIR